MLTFRFCRATGRTVNGAEHLSICKLDNGLYVYFNIDFMSIKMYKKTPLMLYSFIINQAIKLLQNTDYLKLHNALIEYLSNK